MLDEQVQKNPAYKSDENYLAATSKISYAKGDYQTAYVIADKLIKEIEKAFAPDKPFEIKYKDNHIRDSVQYAYIIRYQASAGMRHYADALSDLDHALKLSVSPELLRSKTGVLLYLGKYKEAAAVSDEAYGLNQNIFVSSHYRSYYCGLFKEHNYAVKDCDELNKKMAAEKTTK